MNITILGKGSEKKIRPVLQATKLFGVDGFAVHRPFDEALRDRFKVSHIETGLAITWETFDSVEGALTASANFVLEQAALRNVTPQECLKRAIEEARKKIAAAEPVQ